MAASGSVRRGLLLTTWEAIQTWLRVSVSRGEVAAANGLKSGSPGRIRTIGHPINSRMLYR